MPIRFDDPEHSPTLRARRTSFDRSQSFVSRKSPSPEGQRRGQSFRAAKSFAGRKPKAEVEPERTGPKLGRKDVAQMQPREMQGFETLELSGVTDAGLEPVRETLAAETCSVVSLSVAYCLEITDAGIHSLARGLAANRTVRHLNLSGCRGVTDAAVAELVRAALVDSETPSLHALLLCGCASVGDATAAAAAEAIGGPRQGLAFRALSEGERLQELRVLNLSGCVALTDAGAAILGDALPSALTLEDVSLHGCTQLTDAGGRPLGVGIGGCSSLRSFDLSWCSELADGTALALAEGLAGSQSLRTLKLACCTKLSDVGGDALARALERSNRSLTSLDLSWCPNLGPATVAAFCRSLTRNTTLHTLNTTGCDAMVAPPPRRNQRVAPSPRGKPGAAPAPAAAAPEKGQPASLGKLLESLERNRKRPGLTAASPQARTSAKDDAVGSLRHVSAEELAQLLRAAITNGARQYNAGEGDGCLRLFQRTAESVVAATGSQAIALALQQSNAKSNRPLRERVWALRCAFDALIDELVSQEESTVAKLLNRG